MGSETTKTECLVIYQTSKPYIKNFHTAIDIGCKDGDFTIPLSKNFKTVKEKKKLNKKTACQHRIF